MKYFIKDVSKIEFCTHCDDHDLCYKVQASSFLLTNLIPEGFQSWYHLPFEIFFIQTELFSKKCCVVCSQ